MWAGEQIRSGAWPVTNQLSWTAPDTPWVLHETAIAWLYATVGVQWVGVLRGLVLSVTGLVMCQLAWRPRAGWATAFALAWAAPLFSFAVSERALIYGNLLLALLVWALYTERRWAGRHWRFCDVLAITAVPWVALRLADLLPPRPAGLPQLWLAVLLGLAAVFGRGGSLDTERYPEPLLADLTPEDRLYNDFTLGGWLGHRGQPVFWDSRNDCYPYDVFDDALALDLALSDPGPLLEAYDVDTVVTERTHLVEAVREAGWSHVTTHGPYQLWRR